MPLLVEEELNRAAEVHLGVQFFAGRGQGRNLAAGQAARPLLPASPVVAFAQHIEQDKVFQPPGIPGTKALKAGAGAAPGVLQEGPCSLHDQRRLALKNLFVVDCAGFVPKASQF